jgi:hypothetical protein
MLSETEEGISVALRDNGGYLKAAVSEGRQRKARSH